MGDDYRWRMAQLAQQNASAEFERLVDLVRAIFAMNQLLRYAREERVNDDPMEVPSILGNPPELFESDFKALLKQIIQLNSDDEEVPPEIQALQVSGLSAFETVIEVITHVRQKHHVSYLVQMVDKLLQKNGPFGALVQGRSSRNPRRWHLGGRLLEVFVQLAVLRFDEVEGRKRFYTEPILIDDFLGWVERRYGFVVAPSTPSRGRQPLQLSAH